MQTKGQADYVHLMAQDYLDVALRAYMERLASKRRKWSAVEPEESPERWPATALILDTETTTDPSQRLNFGCARYCRWTDDQKLLCVREELFYADDLATRNPAGLRALRHYALRHKAEVPAKVTTQLTLSSARDFVDGSFLRAAYGAKALVAGFNLPFDLSRFARSASEATTAGYERGFSFLLFEWESKPGTFLEHKYRPRILIKHIDSKRARIKFAARRRGKDETKEAARYPGRFLDLRTLGFALTNESYSLASACEDFGVENGKQKVEKHGLITDGYIDYNRNDVRATQQLLEKMRAEFDHHPIKLDPCKAFSPASIAKAYLRGMGSIPPKRLNG